MTVCAPSRAPRRMTNRSLAAALVVLALVSAACSRTGASADAAVGRGRFRVAIGQPMSLDPAVASQPAERLIDRQLFDALVSYDATTAAVVPDVALSWEISADSTVFTFHLRSDGRFSNGERVTARSFVRGMTRALTPGLHNAPGSLSSELDGIAGAAAVTSGATGTLAGAVAVNDTTLQIHLSAPDAEFLLRCGDGPFDPIPSAAAAGQEPSWADSPVGNGPFQLAATPPGGWLHNPSITLVPNPLHAGGKAHVAQVLLKVIPDPSAAYQAWMAGRVDWAQVPPTSTAQVLRLGKKSAIRGPLAAVDYLTVRAAPGTDALALREALSLAVDRTALSSEVFQGQAAPAVGFVPPIVPGAATALAASGAVVPGSGPCGVCSYDPVRARQLLAQSGASLTGVFPLYFPAGVGEDAWMQAVAQDLRSSLGIDAEAFAVGAAPGAGPGAGPAAAGVSRVMDYPAPDDFLGALLGAAPVGSGAEGTLSPGAAAALNAAISSARGVADPAQRARAYQGAERRAFQELPVIPIVWPEGVVLARLSRWTGLGMDPFGNPTLRTVALKG